jgi:hypothetical protein
MLAAAAAIARVTLISLWVNLFRILGTIDSTPVDCVEAVFFLLPVPSEFDGTGWGQFCLLQVRTCLPLDVRFLSTV